MQIPPPPAAPPKPPVLSAPTTKTIAALPPVPSETTTQMVPSAPPIPTPTEIDPAQDAVDNIVVDSDCPTPAPINTEVEAKLTSEIVKLWGEQRNGKATVRRTRAELKALRSALAEKLHTMKTILARTGRGGGWASYLRSKNLPLTTSDRYVAEHKATLAPREEKLPTEELPTPTVDEIRQLAHKILPKVSRLLITQELVYEFVHELVWNIDVAVASYTNNGFEIPRVGADDALEVDAQAS